ncbi:hypothetical protein CA265_01225 [Sphingobacteriaceae bacterium GW460-11-11-14-LB5]|nr:hypothetical protein CA265_01225 [Sphingobacteriaceae bacterium GW460-11-11-14-LB5]
MSSYFVLMMLVDFLSLSKCLVRYNPPKMIMKGTKVTTMPTNIFFPKMVKSDNVIFLGFIEMIKVWVMPCCKNRMDVFNLTLNRTSF